MGPVATSAPEKVYLGVFGGGGASNQVGLSQYGTAFFPEASGGPLAVNAFGKSNTRNVGLVGAHLGYQWEDILLASFSNQANVSPAVELEGYYVGKSNFTGHEIDSDTTRLLEHDFLVTYPTSTGVILANTVQMQHRSRCRHLKPMSITLMAIPMIQQPLLPLKPRLA